MKHLALLTVLIGLFFGSLAVVLAGPSVPPQQYYVRWSTPVHYTCTHWKGDYRLDVLPAHYDYYVPQDAQMIAIDKTSSSYGHSSGAEPTVTHWPNGAGQKTWGPAIADSKSYPITAQVILETFIDNKLVYVSTYTANCTSDSNGTLNAAIDNNAHPLHAEVWSEGSLGFYRP